MANKDVKKDTKKKPAAPDKNDKMPFVFPPKKK